MDAKKPPILYESSGYLVILGIGMPDASQNTLIDWESQRLSIVRRIM